MSDIKFIEGGIFTDYRGQISHVNDLDMQEIKRFYIIQCWASTGRCTWCWRIGQRNRRFLW